MSAHSQNSSSGHLCRVAAPVARSQAFSFWKLRWSALVPAERRHPEALPEPNPTRVMFAGSRLVANPATFRPAQRAMRRRPSLSTSLLARPHPVEAKDPQALRSLRGLPPVRLGSEVLE